MQHATHTDRTTPMPQAVQEALLSSGLARAFPLSTDPPNASGPLSDLHGTSHYRAFEAMVMRLA